MNRKVTLQLSILCTLSIILMPLVGLRVIPVDASVTSRNGYHLKDRLQTLSGVSGVVTDATSDDPIENAYVIIQNTTDGLDFYADAFTDVNGAYLIPDLLPGTYYMYASAEKHQPSFYPAGWPAGATVIDLTDAVINIDFSLVSSQMEWSPGNFDVLLAPGKQLTQTLTINNSGSGPLFYFLNVLDESAITPPPAPAELPVPGLPRIDPQLLVNLDSASDGKADFVVVLKSQADLSGAQAILNWNTRGEYVYETLKNHADANQQGLRHTLQNSGVSYHPLYIINGIIIHGGSLQMVNNLAARSDVAQIIANRIVEIDDPISEPAAIVESIEWNLTMVGAPSVWSEYGVTGEGIIVSEIDTGTQWDHPALINQYRGWDGITVDHNYNWFDPYGQSPFVPGDAHGHGTHVMGTMVGDDDGDNQIGMAPGAQWIACKGYDNVSGYLLTAELLQCAEWILAPTDLNGDNPEPSQRPHVVNNSWGGGQDDYWFTGVVDAWMAAGIFTMFSIGNEGPECSSASSPGDNLNIFSAGASDSSDQIASFSGRGPTLVYGNLKPDITAPGSGIRSSVPTNRYRTFSGTSMASPHVAGAVALLWSSNPEIIGQINLTQWVLQQTATPKVTNEGCGGDLTTDVPNNTWGWGRLDIYAAVKLARTGGIVPDWLSVSPIGGVVPAGGSQDVILNFHPSLDMSGTFSATLWLVADDPLHSEVRIPIEMTIVDIPVLYNFLPFLVKLTSQ